MRTERSDGRVRDAMAEEETGSRERYGCVVEQIGKKQPKEGRLYGEPEDPVQLTVVVFFAKRRSRRWAAQWLCCRHSIPPSGRLLPSRPSEARRFPGFIHCSTIKPVIAVALCRKGVSTRDTMIRVGPAKVPESQEALGAFNIPFEEMERRWGRHSSHYGRLLGLGETCRVTQM